MLVGFLNTNGVWFPKVHQQFEFCLYCALKRGDTSYFRSAFRVNSLDKPSAISSGHGLRVPLDLVHEFSPDAMAIMEFAVQEEIDICANIYARYPKFGDVIEGLPYRHYMAEVHMGSNRDVFCEGEAGIPLIEGRMLDLYDYRAKEYALGRGRSATWRELRFGSSEKKVKPQWRIRSERIPTKIISRMNEYRIGFCDVVNPGTEKCLIATLIPPGTACGHTVPTILFRDGQIKDMLLWIGVANSLAMDFIVRKKVRLHVSYTVLDSLPFPRDYRTTPAAEEIVRKVCALCAVGPEMAAFRERLIPLSQVALDVVCGLC